MAGSQPLVDDAPDDPRGKAYAARHAELAHSLGLEPLTVGQRAAAMLSKACNGWRRERRCRNHSDEPLIGNHPACILAQYQHDALLLDHSPLSGHHSSDAVLVTVPGQTLAALARATDRTLDDDVIGPLLDALITSESPLTQEVIDRYLAAHGDDREQRKAAATRLYEGSNGSIVTLRHLRRLLRQQLGATGAGR